MKVPCLGQSVPIRKIIIFLFILFIHNHAFAQFTEYNTGQYEDVWNDVAVDSEGYIYVVGTYTNETIIDGNTLNNGIAPGLNHTQLMVAKYDPLGNISWISYGVAPCPDKGWTTGMRIAIGEESGKVFIAGEHAGMKLETGSGTYVIDDIPDSLGVGCLGDDNIRKPYIISLAMSNGDFQNYTNDLRGVVTSMAVATDGVFANHLYTSLYNEVDKITFIYRVAPGTLLPAGGNHLIQTISTGIDHIITDIKYKKGKIYCIGTTVGSVQFGALTLSISLPPSGSTAWAAIVNNPFGSISVLAMNHAGLGGKVTGDQIYLDGQGNIIVAGRYSDALIYPFNSPQAYTSLSSAVLKNAYLMKLNQNTLIANDAIQTIETTTSQYNVSSVSLTGSDNKVFVSLTYTGKFLFFTPSGSIMNLTSPVNINNSSKVAVTSYTVLPTLNNLWRNSTYGISANDLGYEKANAVFEDQVYSAGNLKERMYFDHLPTLNSPISSSSPSKKAMLIRNDDSYSGAFKSYAGKDDKLNDIQRSIYPNPNDGSFYISGVSQIDKIEVFDLLGKTISFTLSFLGDRAYIEIDRPTTIVIVKINDVGHSVMMNE